MRLGCVKVLLRGWYPAWNTSYKILATKLLKMLFNEIAPKMHNFRATRVGGYMFLQHRNSGGGHKIFWSSNRGGGSQKYCHGTFGNSWPPYSKENGGPLIGPNIGGGGGGLYDYQNDSNSHFDITIGVHWLKTQNFLLYKCQILLCKFWDFIIFQYFPRNLTPVTNKHDKHRPLYRSTLLKLVDLWRQKHLFGMFI